MDYLYENLGDERFQEFCNCLIAKEFSNTQSFPVGQPDGGRDSLVYSMDKKEKQFNVFQVKFVRNPNSIEDVHKWLTDTIKKEAPKVDKLIPKGAKNFYLLTNVRGTAHLDVGSKDKVNEILELDIKIPSLCWWRDDLSRLLEKDPIFKWSFPEILNGQDILNSILFQNINENKDKRESIIKAYLADQYATDNKVKFRQVDLENRLFDLFTDVPIRIRKINEKNKHLKKTLDQFESYHDKTINTTKRSYEERENIGAASFLLHPKIQSEVERILLEGGPGQGKSTISQYICQVHRVRLLNKIDDLVLLPEELKNTQIRLPFKIDLRHVASWVENKNPYHGRLNDEYFSSIWKNSLESFLVGHVVYHSQIDDFNSGDLIAILRNSSVIFVFDGFDEIADIKVRGEVIEFINRGINRLKENSNSVQVLITSRPAAFSDTIGFSIDSYPHFELTDITPSITKTYVDKWIKACKLDIREGNEIRRLVDEKLKMPHLRELAKSPMQLAIFISLLRTRGESLPNKRTALYDSYIELFFNRESEKNTMIRDHRDLIIDIHQYLAWILHSEAELYNNTGNIHIDTLKIRLKEYLSKEGHKTEIADNLFHVMEERVCALVSRIQGTYEFEVQPLREYFCAKYLYNTSPYSPAGFEKRGTKPERFDAIARNFYWHNVVRFFAGCFDKGELPLLIQKLKELQEDEILKNTNHPRLLTSQILSDWVFTQYPLLMKDVVKIIVDGINIGSIINQEEYDSSNESIILPNDCGRNELTIECFEQLKKFPPNDFANELIGIIKNNPYKTVEFWTSISAELSGEKLTRWLEYAYHLEIVQLIEDTLLIKIIEENFENDKRMQLLLNGNRFNIINSNIEFKKFVLNSVLERKMVVFLRKSSEHSLQFLTLVLHPFILQHILREDQTNLSFLQTITARFRPSHHDSSSQIPFNSFPVNDEVDRLIENFAKSIDSCLHQEINIWKTSIEPWELIIENFRKVFKDKWIIFRVAVISAKVKDKIELGDEYAELENNSISLCKRVKYAKSKGGNVKYWKHQLEKSISNYFVLFVFFVWGTPKVIMELIATVESMIENLTPEDYLRLNTAVSQCSIISLFTSSQRKAVEDFFIANKTKPEISYIVSHRFQDINRNRFISENISLTGEILKDEVNNIRLAFLIENYFQKPDNETLQEIKKIYSNISYVSEESYNRNMHRLRGSFELPIDAANFIMNDAKKYPRIIASAAERTCRMFANRNVIMVGQIANENVWFD